MKVFVTRPRVERIPLNDRLEAYWKPYNPEFVTNFPYETHGELLTRIWNMIRYNLDQSDGIYVISENDFVPDAGLYDEIVQWLYPPKNLRRMLITPYLTYNANNIFHENHWPLANPSFIALRLDNVDKWPPLTWLSACGPHNDAANGAVKAAIDSGFATPTEIVTPEEIELPECKGGIYYKNLGLHFFFARHFSDPPDTLLLPGCHSLCPTYTVKDHLKGIEACLAKLKK